MSHLLDWLIRRVGRRGLALGILGLIWVLYGLGLLVTGTAPQNAASPADAHIWHQSIDPVVRGVVWSGSGVLALFTAASRPRTDTPGFLALTVCPMIHAFSFLTAWVIWLLPIHERGYAEGLVSASTWATVVTLIALIASWPEQTPIGGERE